MAMKQYVIDGLRPNDYNELKKYLDEIFEVSPLGGIYWVELPENILTTMQNKHEDCRPHVFALMLENNSLAAELLVRIKTNIKCDCMGYANAEQREWLIKKVDLIFEELEILI
jgi:hypothetical protein